VEKILNSEKEYGLQHFDYLEIITQWIWKHKSTEEVVDRLWRSVRQLELSYGYLQCCSQAIRKNDNIVYTLPEVVSKNHDEYQFHESPLFLLSKITQVQQQIVDAFDSRNKRHAKTVILPDTLDHVKQFLGGNAIALPSIDCKYCGAKHAVTLKLTKPYSQDLYLNIQTIMLWVTKTDEIKVIENIFLSSTMFQSPKMFNKMVKEVEKRLTSEDTFLTIRYVYSCRAKHQPINSSKKRKIV